MVFQLGLGLYTMADRHHDVEPASWSPPLHFFKYFLSQLYLWVIIPCINCGHQGTATNMQGTETAFERALLF